MNYQIRTNAKNFGDTTGMYVLEGYEYGYYREEKGESFTCKAGYKWEKDNDHHSLRYKRKAGKFVKQTDFNHGTLEMDKKEARELVAKLSDNARNCWVRLYEMN